MRLQFALLLFSLLHIFTAYGKLCPKSVQTKRSEIVLRQSTRMVTKRSWYGGIKTVSEPYTYQYTEWHWDTKTQLDCCTGFVKVDGNCLPYCIPTCPLNSRCLDSNLCICNLGFRSSTTSPHDCEPFCSNGCPEYSHCEKPELCECNEGYYRNGTVCAPTCTKGCPAEASCQAPEQCICNSDGYTLNTEIEKCQPYCRQKCPANSYCAKPNSCLCQVGYRESLSTIFDGIEDAAELFCEPVCAPECGTNSFCQTPNQCVCQSGYKRQQEKLNAPKEICRPICQMGCPAYSTCSAPDICHCDEGYIMNSNSTQCDPVCTETCPQNSRCYSPDRCVCDEGYTLNDLPGINRYCEPQCQTDCSPFGKCTSPNVCECFTGYEMQTVAAGGPLCEPKCSQSCEHGFCFAPEVCVCHPGYLMGPNSTCTAVCSLGCVNAVCEEPEICKCLPGHRLAPNSVHSCEPICAPECENADCAAPDICICWQNFVPAESEVMVDGEYIHTCKPTCKHKCDHGYCSAPDTCRCNEGYDPHSYIPNVCVPHCDHCNYGDCVEPGVCHCWDGYEESGSDRLCLFVETTTLLNHLAMETSVADTTSITTLPSQFRASTTENTKLLTSLYPNIWNTVIPTTVIYTEAPTPALPQLYVCNSRCKCWQELFDSEQRFESARNKLKCTPICLDEYETHCQNYKRCSCDLTNLRLSCNVTEDSMEEDRVVDYTCKQPFLSVTTSSSRNIPTSLSNDEQKSTESLISLLWIIGLVCLAVLLLGGFYKCWRQYTTRIQTHERNKGEPIVDYSG